MINRIRIWLMDKSEPLQAVEATAETICVLCDGPISPGEWIVQIEDKGAAHPACAGGYGWEIS